MNLTNTNTPPQTYTAPLDALREALDEAITQHNQEHPDLELVAAATAESQLSAQRRQNAGLRRSPYRGVSDAPQLRLTITPARGDTPYGPFCADLVIAGPRTLVYDVHERLHWVVRAAYGASGRRFYALASALALLAIPLTFALLFGFSDRPYALLSLACAFVPIVVLGRANNTADKLERAFPALRRFASATAVIDSVIRRLPTPPISPTPAAELTRPQGQSSARTAS